MEEHPQNNTLHNFFAFGSDAVLFSIGLTGLMNVSIILPEFMERLGGTPTMVGLLSTIIGLAWSTPQLIAGNIAGRFRRKKPFVLGMAVTGRIFVPALAGLVVLTQANPPWLSLIGLYVAMTLYLGTDGFATIGWLDMLGRAIPQERRGSYIAIWQAATSIGISAVAPVVALILGPDGPPFPNNYALLVGLGGLFLFLSLIGTWNIKEPQPTESDPHSHHVAWRDLFSHLRTIWQQDVRLRRIAVARVFFSFGMMAYPFYVVYATQELKLPVATLGAFIFGQTLGTMIGSLGLGRISDRYGAQRAVQAGSAVILTAPVLALVLVFKYEWLSGYLALVYTWIYICVGLANNLLFLGFANYTLEIAPAGQRPIYSGAVNTINSIGVLAPTFAGWLLAETSYGVLFGLTLAVGIVALLMALRLPPSRGA